MKNYKDYFLNSIDLDLHRTFPKTENPENTIKSIRNILLAYSRRNSYIGYCQGMNFIVLMLLSQKFTEEECFWMLAMLIECFIPNDYYSTMLGTLCDQKVFSHIIKEYDSEIGNKLSDLGIDSSIFCIQWFVCIFTNSLNNCIIQVIWDHLFIEGSVTLLKAGLVILKICKQQILKAKEFPDVIILIEENSKTINNPYEFNKMLNEIYINKYALNQARELQRDLYYKEQYKININRPKQQTNFQYRKVICDRKYPMCQKYLEKSKSCKQDLQYFIFISGEPINLIKNYWNDNIDKPTIKKSSTQLRLSTKRQLKLFQEKELLISRYKHKCKPKELPITFDEQMAQQNNDKRDELLRQAYLKNMNLNLQLKELDSPLSIKYMQQQFDQKKNNSSNDDQSFKMLFQVPYDLNSCQQSQNQIQLSSSSRSNTEQSITYSKHQDSQLSSNFCIEDNKSEDSDFEIIDDNDEDDDEEKKVKDNDQIHSLRDSMIQQQYKRKFLQNNDVNINSSSVRESYFISKELLQDQRLARTSSIQFLQTLPQLNSSFELIVKH